MAILNKITIGDIQYVHLKDRPDLVQTDAPVGTLGIWKNPAGRPRIYLKNLVGNALNAWYRVDNTWNIGGNNLTGFPVGIIGGDNAVDVDVTLTRYGNRVITLGKKVEAGFLNETVEFFHDVTQSTPVGRLMFRSYSGNAGNGDPLLNFSQVISTSHLDEPVSPRQRRSIVIDSQGDVAQLVNERSIVNMYGKNYSETEDFLRNIATMSSADIVQSSAGGLLTKIVGQIFKEPLLLAELEVTLIVYKEGSSSDVTHYKKTATVSIVNSATRDYALLFQADDYTYFQGEIPTMTLSLVNGSNATDYDPAFTGNCEVQVNVSGLTPSVDYKYFAVCKVKGIQNSI